MHSEAAVTYHADRVQKTKLGQEQGFKKYDGPSGPFPVSQLQFSSGKDRGENACMENAMSFEAGTVRACQSA